MLNLDVLIFSIIKGKIDLHMPVFRFMDPQYLEKKITSRQNLLDLKDLLNLVIFVKKNTQE